MIEHKIRIGALLLASAMALTFSISDPAFARGRGGGGGGGGRGGGGGGGHAFHAGGGGGGGGIHFGGGGMHLGGGGLHLGGLRLGGLRLGGSHFGGSHFGRTHIAHLGRTGGTRLSARNALHSGNLASRDEHSVTGANEHAANTERGNERTANTANAARGSERTANTVRNNERTNRPNRNALPFGSRAYAHNHWQSWRDGRFTHGWQNWQGYPVFFGWAGPLFWPYAYDDIFDDLFWGYGYADPFWDYGFGDLLAGLFSPYGYGDLAGYMPGGAGYASGAGPRLASRGRAGVATASTAAPLAGELQQMCGEDAKNLVDWPIERIQQLVAPTAAQRTALDDLANASSKAAEIIRTACPSAVAFTPTGRLEAMQTRIDAMIQAAAVVRGPLGRFYNSLSDEQKARFNAAGHAPDQSAEARTSFVQNCRAASAALTWPQEQIEKAIRPTAAQQSRLDALRSAANKAAGDITASCPAELPLTPPARLDAIVKRLDAMLKAVKVVRSALNDFYGSLNDEQKAQFNVVGEPRVASAETRQP